jgi:hypothetical protein
VPATPAASSSSLKGSRIPVPTDAKQNSDLRTFNAEYVACREHSVSSWARLCHGHAASQKRSQSRAGTAG